jgi:hypothetical protein
MSYDSGFDHGGFSRSAYGAGELDLGLRQYMLRVYHFMAADFTGLVAYAAVADRLLPAGRQAKIHVDCRFGREPQLTLAREPASFAKSRYVRARMELTQTKR